MSGWSNTAEYKVSPPWPPHAAGRFYSNFVELSTGSGVAFSKDILYAIPIFVPSKKTYVTLGLELVTPSGTINGRVGIYSDTAGAPGALVLDAGVIAFATPAAFKSAVISQSLDPGTYWLVVVFDTNFGAMRVRETVQSGCMRMLGFTSGTDTTPHPGWSVAFAYAALPNPFQAGGALISTNIPRLMIGP